MPGILSYTLGLEASGFLRSLGLAHGQILSFAGIMEGLKTVGEHAFKAIEQGQGLFDLSGRTAESVKTLYQMQEAFKIVGLGADSAAPMIRRLHLAIAGVDEMGQRLDGVFEDIGISVDDLKKMDAPQQFLKISEAILRLPKEQASFFSSKVFGREGGAAFLQLARDSESFRQTLRETSKDAAFWGKIAPIFDKIGDTITLIKGKFDTFWAGIAYGFSGALQKVLDLVNAIDFGAIGIKIGTFFATIAEAFHQGKFAELFSTALKAGLEEVGNFGFAIFSAWFVFLTERMMSFGHLFFSTLSNLFIALGSILAGAFQKAASLLAEALGHILLSQGANSLSAALFEQAGILSGESGLNFKRGHRDLTGALDNAISGEIDGLLTSFETAFEAFKSAPNIFGTSQIEKLGKLWGDLSRALGRPDIRGRKPGDLDLGTFSGATPRSDRSDWEKMGLILRNTGPGFGPDYSRQTAQNTTTMVNTLSDIRNLLPGLGVNPGDFANRH